MKLLEERQGKNRIILLLLISFVLFFYGLGDRDLWAPDEDEYAQISREMIRTNNWMYPTVNGEPWTIKPPLYNWLVSIISLPWGDVDEFRARIFSALAALAVVVVTFQIGRLAFSPLTGFLGALVLATSLLFFHHARWAQTYMLSTFFATLAIFLFYRGYRIEEKRTVSYLLMYVAVGLGFLTMGPVNLAVPGLDKEIIAEALSHCRPSGRVSFADAPVWATAVSSGVRKVYTFDERFPDAAIQVLRRRT